MSDSKEPNFFFDQEEARDLERLRQEIENSAGRIKAPDVTKGMTEKELEAFHGAVQEKLELSHNSMKEGQKIFITKEQAEVTSKIPGFMRKKALEELEGKLETLQRFEDDPMPREESEGKLRTPQVHIPLMDQLRMYDYHLVEQLKLSTKRFSKVLEGPTKEQILMSLVHVRGQMIEELTRQNKPSDEEE